MNKRIKILYIYHVSVIGGGSFCLLNIIKHLDKSLFQPIVLLKDEGPLVIELIRNGAIVFFEKSIETVPYNSSILKINSIIKILRIIKSIRIIKNWYKILDPEIIHLNSMMLYPYLISASNLNIKKIIHIRENWPKNEHRYQFLFAKKVISAYCDRIIAINNTSAKMFYELNKISIINDYINFDDRNKTFELKKILGNNITSLKIFTFFGGINWQKGTLEIIETFHYKLCDEKLRLLVIGCPSKNIEYNGFFGLVKKTLSYINYYTYSDKAKIIAQKDDRIIFLPSTYHVKSIIEQSFCIISYFTIPHANLTLAESSILGVPSIAANTKEAMEYCLNGKTAVLFKMNDKKDFSDKIQYLIDNYDTISMNTKKYSNRIQFIFDPIINNDLLRKTYLSTFEEY